LIDGKSTSTPGLPHFTEGWVTAQWGKFSGKIMGTMGLINFNYQPLSVQDYSGLITKSLKT
jgi:hypothetical protein